MKDVQFYIHVGMPKAASTFLQNYFFPNLKGISYWEIYKHPNSYLIESFINTNYLHVNSEVKEKLALYLEQSAEKKVLLSYESFFGNYANNYNLNYTNSLLLKEVFDKPYIILIIRKQDELLESNYNQLVKQGYSKPFHQYINYYRGKYLRSIDSSSISINRENLNYLQYIDNYIELFGKDRLLVLPFELLKQDRHLFLEKITSFTQTQFEEMAINESGRTKKSLSAVSLPVARFFNRFFITDISNGNGFIPRQPYMFPLKRRMKSNPLLIPLYYLSKYMGVHTITQIIDRIYYKRATPMNEQQRKELMQYYAPNNQELDQKYHLGLKKFGYY